MRTATPPNYYDILGISESATTWQIRDAYKRAALKTHPDRVPAESPERPIRTRRFQLVNDAYFTLSDEGRRREYDAQRKLFGGAGSAPSTPGDFDADDEDESEPEEAPKGSAAGTGKRAQDQGQGPAPAGGGGFSWAWNFFTGQRGADDPETRRRTENDQFGDVFEEMLREEGMGPDSEAATAGRGPLGQVWGMLGGLSGGALGFIVGNMPGLVAGAVAGNRLGSIRDARGKSVYAVFQELPQDDRGRLLSQLAAKVFSHAVGI